MRTLNSAKNLLSSLSITFVMIFLGFLTRKIFVDNIGVEYLGLNGLLQNILGVMSLLEGGFATSVVYNLYKPVANRDYPRILALLQLYKKVYRYIAFGIFVCALLLYPFIDLFVKDIESLSYVSVIYFIFLFNSLIQYFTAYKWAIINVSQQNYKLTAINLSYQVGLNLAKLLILYYTKDYILYLVIESLFGIGLNYAIVKKANKLFPYIVTKEKYTVDASTKKNIITNMKALFLHSIGGYLMHSTDNIIISSFVGIGIVGLYSNYTLLVNTIGNMVMQVLNSFSESVGNLIASETSEKTYGVFQTLFLVNFLVVSLPIVIMYNTITPFIKWWLGEQYLLEQAVLCVILLNFYIDKMRNSSLTFKVKSGIFVQDRFTPLLQGIINLILSLLFVHRYGLFGILMATCLSILSIGFWQFPRLIYKHTFHKPLWNYFKYYVYYTLILFVTLVLSVSVCSLNVVEDLFVHTLVNGILSLICALCVYWLLLHRLTSYRQLKTYVLNLISVTKTKIV